MNSIEFSWDHSKNKINQKKHNISFEEAKTAFYDPNPLLISDPEHSFEEERFILLGLSYGLRLLLICHCYRKHMLYIRISSARKATKKEQKQYEERL